MLFFQRDHLCVIKNAQLITKNSYLAASLLKKSVIVDFKGLCKICLDSHLGVFLLNKE